MPDAWLHATRVRPIDPSERARFDTELAEHHWLGHRLIGQTMRYVAVSGDGEWLALVGFGAAALACRPRDLRLGWSEDQQFARLRYVVNNQRFCVLPAGRTKNLASHLLSVTLRRLSSDYETRWGHPVLVVETFVDPSRHAGTCYQAAGFEMVGRTSGYGRVAGRYVHHGNEKLTFLRPLRRDAQRLLVARFDHPVLRVGRSPVLDLNRLSFDGEGGLLARLEEIADHRKRRGVRHQLASVLALAVAATLSGARSVAAIGEHAADCPQEVLCRLGAKYHPVKGRYIAPHAQTFRRALREIDAEALDAVVGRWLFDQVKAGAVSEAQVVLALDGKSMRGSLRGDGRAVHLFSAMVHEDGVVVAQREVGEKSNEITALRPLLGPLDLDGALVTADALHTQREHATFLVEDKRAHYLFQVKANQPTLLAQIQAIEDTAWSAAFEETCRGHGRTEHRYVAVAEAPAGVDFPYARSVVRVERDRADLADRMISEETSYYITSIEPTSATPERMGRHVRGHWGIENKLHWVRDWAYDEDRHQMRGGTPAPRVLATLRNLAISLLRLAGATNITAALRWVSRDPARAAALIGA